MASNPERPTVITPEGAIGQVETESDRRSSGTYEVLVNFFDRERLWVPADMLILQEDGNYRLQVPLAALEQQLTRPTIATRPASLDELVGGASPEATQPLQRQEEPGALASSAAEADESGPDQTPPPPGEGAAPSSDEPRVSAARVVNTVREEIEAELLREEVTIHRVPVNEYVDSPPPIRYEDDRIIVPVLEEVLVVEKRLLVKEEVVITKRRERVTDRRAVTRDRSDVEIGR
jgi:uncharacterized protein (TIGR02271 family)